MPRSKIQAVLRYLQAARCREPDPWYADDYAIAYLTVLYIKRKRPEPFVLACWKVAGCHPDQLWLKIMERRRALVGEHEWARLYPVTPIAPPAKKSSPEPAARPAALARKASA
jgi:hypothetical protein